MRIEIRKFIEQTDQAKDQRAKRAEIRKAFIEPHLRVYMEARVMNRLTAKVLSAMESIISS